MEIKSGTLYINQTDLEHIVALGMDEMEKEINIEANLKGIYHGQFKKIVVELWQTVDIVGEGEW